MLIHNVHERTVDGDAGALLDTLASGDGDRLWPNDRWPRMKLDRGLAPGSSGGHGPIRYAVVAYEPGTLVRFRFEDMPGVRGEHGFEVLHAGDRRTLIRHTANLEATGRAAIRWRLIIARLHDALVEDALDRAAKAPHRPHSKSVRLTRWLLTRTTRRGTPTPIRGTSPMPTP
jgi:hypothetical protein